MGSRSAVTLSELNHKIKGSLEESFPFPLWVVAEISEINARQHCYLELVEKDEKSDKLIAKSRATIWAYTYNMLKPYFETSTGYSLQSGIKVMLRVEIQYSELYGISLNVKDIDPNYTLGDLERRKREILNRLEEDGVLDMNKNVELPQLPKTIAIISSPKAAGYQDFVKQIQATTEKYGFHLKLFSSIMQGTQATESIIKALEQIYELEDLFDAVVIIRGGGATSDLACFNTYDLAVNIAQFPLPVITGIGHDKDISIADMVAHTSLKTPTAVADFLLGRFESCQGRIADFVYRLTIFCDEYFEDAKDSLRYSENVFRYTLPERLQKLRLQQNSRAVRFSNAVNDSLHNAQNRIERAVDKISFSLHEQNQVKKQRLAFFEEKLSFRVKNSLDRQRRILANKEKVLELLSPEKLLKRGYSITTLEDGTVLKDAKSVTKGTVLKTQLINGELQSVVMGEQ